MCNRDERPQYLSVTAYEIDPVLAEYLEGTLAACRLECNRAGVDFEFTVLQEDFIAAGTSMLRGDLFGQKPQEFGNVKWRAVPGAELTSRSSLCV
jgi:adenine-specific DNA-methyltransferase